MFRADYAAVRAHRFEGVYSYFKETDDRTDLDFVSARPAACLHELRSQAVRAGVALGGDSNFQNELRGGANLAPVQFITDWDYSAGVLLNTALSIINPVAGTAPSKSGASASRTRVATPNTYQLNDNASWLLGRHELQMGGSWQRNKVNPYNFRGQFPRCVRFQPGGARERPVDDRAVPRRISAAELANANALASWLGGISTSVARPSR